MRYGKLIDGALHFAPRTITAADGKVICTNAPWIWAEYGYKPVVFAEPPEDAEKGFVNVCTYEETDSEIIQRWETVDDPNAGSDDAAEMMAILRGEADA